MGVGYGHERRVCLCSMGQHKVERCGVIRGKVKNIESGVYHIIFHARLHQKCGLGEEQGKGEERGY